MSQTLLIAFMLGLTVSARAADKPATASKPNIIFILALLDPDLPFSPIADSSAPVSP